MSVDLHLHTHYSDGTWSPADLVKRAIELRFDAIALTDHDTVSGITEAEEAAQGKLEIVPGIEINTIWLNPEGKRQDVHILGYFIDRNNPDLLAILAKQQQARFKFIEESINKFVSAGYKISFQDVQSFAGKGSLGRPHLSQAILKAGAANSIGEAYKMLLNHDSKFHVARQSISPQEAITAIKKAGGLASLAHPNKDKFVNELLQQLKEAGLSAIEAYHRGHSLSTVKKYQRLAHELDLLVTGGSDCHGPYEGQATIGLVLVPNQVLNKLREKASTSHL